MVNWDGSDLEAMLAKAGFSQVEIVEERQTSELRLGTEQIERWFSQNTKSERPTFAQHLLKATDGTGVSPAELEKLKDIFENQLLGQVVTWQSTVAYVMAHKI